MCTLVPRVVARPSEVVADLRTWLNGEPEPAGRGFSGLFDLTNVLSIALEIWGTVH